MWLPGGKVMEEGAVRRKKGSGLEYIAAMDIHTLSKMKRKRSKIV
jgi:hypothetical protein